AVLRVDGLRPGTVHEVEGITIPTLPEPGGEMLCRFATVNDVHFGETECGIVEGTDVPPVLSSRPGEPPYPLVMNDAAVEEIAQFDPTIVVAKGDLTTIGTLEEYQQFRDCYGTAFGDRLVHVRGNHDAKDVAFA